MLVVIAEVALETSDDTGNIKLVCPRIQVYYANSQSLAIHNRLSACKDKVCLKVHLNILMEYNVSKGTFA